MPRNEKGDLSSAQNPQNPPGARSPAASAASGLVNRAAAPLYLRLPQTLAVVLVCLGALFSASSASASISLGSANTTSLSNGLVG